MLGAGKKLQLSHSAEKARKLHLREIQSQLSRVQAWGSQHLMLGTSGSESSVADLVGNAMRREGRKHLDSRAEEARKLGYRSS